MSGQTPEFAHMAEHEFRPVAGHPDDDECTHRSDGTDATYCGHPRVWHDHHPRCYQNTEVPDGLPATLCDCRVLRMIDQADVSTPPAPEHRLIGSMCSCGDWSAQCGNDIQGQWLDHVRSVTSSPGEEA